MRLRTIAVACSLALAVTLAGLAAIPLTGAAFADPPTVHPPHPAKPVDTPPATTPPATPPGQCNFNSHSSVDHCTG
jgi:hypothetical protein